MKYTKYPRTYHIPYSPGSTSDDKTLTQQQFYNFFHGEYITITEKMDGECTTIYSDYIHARSLDSRHHSSRDWVKRFQSEIGHNIPEGWRICGENLFAKHSISYDNLDSYFYGFSIWDDTGNCLSTKETEVWFDLLGIKHAPIVTQFVNLGNWQDRIRDYAELVVEEGGEGIVIRNDKRFHYNVFKNNVAKYVRANHVTSSEHWSHQQIVPNKLKA